MAGREVRPADTLRSVDLVSVSDAAEERAVLERLSTCGGPMAPVPVPADQIGKVLRLASDHGYTARVVEARDFLAGDRTRRRGQPSAASAPTVVALPLVDEQLVALAEHLSGRPTVHDVEHDPRLREPGATALVLLDLGSPTDAAWRVFALLGERGIPFAVVLADGDSAGRLSLLKALLFPTVEVVDVDRSDTLLAEHAGMAGAMRRILMISGHGNSIDIGDRGVVICPRHDASPSEMAGLYPCFGDRRCFRQPLFGRNPESAEGLIDPARFRHALVLLLGCASFVLGDVPFARRGTILWRMAESDALAAVATVGVFYHDSNVETALLALLLEGCTLGETVRIFNAWHREVYGRTSPACEGFGPLVAVGNPLFRLERGLLRTFPEPPAVEGVGVPSTAIGLAEGGLGIVEIEGDGLGEGRLLSVPSPATGAGVRIAGARGGEGPSTYVSVRFAAGSGEAPSFDLQPFDRRACVADQEVLRDSMPHLALWRLLLSDAGCPMASALGEQGAQIIPDVDVLGMERLLREYLATNAFASDALIPTLSALAAHRLVMERWRRCQASMLEAASLYVRRTGGFLFHLWQQFYTRGRGKAARRACPSCGRETEYLSYHWPTDPADRHHVVHCPACGVLGQLPEGVAVRANRPLGPSRRGDMLKLDFEVVADRSAALRGELMLVRESWFRAAGDIAGASPIAIHPGAGQTISFALPVSPRLAPGLYPLTLLGVVNGGLVQIRRHISVLERDS